MQNTMNTATFSPTSPKVKRRQSARIRQRTGSYLPPQQTQETHDAALYSIRTFLRSRTSYDAFPVSFRVIVLDSQLEVKKALQCLLLNGVVSAPLWNSEKSVFAGMFTVSDIIHLIQYYYHTSSYDNATTDVETFRLESLRDIEKSLGVATPPLIHEHPSAPLYDAAQRLIQTHARRLPLLDNDSETGHQVIVSVLTQYRLLKFIAINCTRDIQSLHLPLRKLGIGTYVQHDPSTGEPQLVENPYHPIATSTMDTTVFDVVHMFSERGISAVPIIDENGVVVNLYETDFPGVVICNRLVVVEGEVCNFDSYFSWMYPLMGQCLQEEERKGGKKGRLLGIITLSDVLRYVVGPVNIQESVEPEEPPIGQPTAGSTSTATETGG